MAQSAEIEIVSHGHLEWCAHWRQGLRELHGFCFLKKLRVWEIKLSNGIRQLKEVAWQVRYTKLLAQGTGKKIIIIISYLLLLNG